MTKKERIQELKEMYLENPGALIKSFMITNKTLKGIVGDFQTEAWTIPPKDNEDDSND